MGWIIIWLLTALSTPPQTNYAASNPDSERSLTAIRNDLKSALRAEAAAVDGSGKHRGSIIRLLSLHCEMVGHSTFRDGFALKQSRSLLQSRLVRVARQIERRSKDKPQAKQPQFIPRAFDMIPVLAQQLGGGPNIGQGGRGVAGAGGPALGGGLGGGAAIGQLPDYGPELADLIRQVISPDSWIENGGTSTVVYYAPLRAIVVRSTAAVHDDLRNFLFDLRAAGGP